MRHAAGQGDAGAQHDLGVMYAYGGGGPQDYAEAMRWYRLAAEQGMAEAQYNLGRMYFLGQGVPEDYVQAHKWINPAASRLTGEDRENAVRTRDTVADQMTSDQVAEAQRLAREWDAAHPR